MLDCKQARRARAWVRGAKKKRQARECGTRKRGCTTKEWRTRMCGGPFVQDKGTLDVKKNKVVPWYTCIRRVLQSRLLSNSELEHVFCLLHPPPPPAASPARYPAIQKTPPVTPHFAPHTHLCQICVFTSSFPPLPPTQKQPPSYPRALYAVEDGVDHMKHVRCTS